MAKYLRSPLKWAGGKYRILGRILPALPPGSRLVEPFLGSGAVFLNSEYPAYLLADLNSDLIAFFKELSSGGKEFIELCRSYFTASGNSPELFYARREGFNRSGPGPERAALFLYLNRHAYNGLMRYNASGLFNTPFGRYARPYFPELELRAVQDKFHRADVSFAAQGFERSFAALRPGDVVYCDPPYLPLSQTANFTEYTVGGFGSEAQAALALAAREAQKKGCPVVISNHATEAALELYKDARSEMFDVSRSISCKAGGRGGVGELLAVYGV